ncbi:MAG: hypothetical protein ACRENP_06300 [Longimicrobiales bacterium]
MDKKDDVWVGIREPSSNEPEPKPQPVSDAVGGIVGTAAGAGLGALAGPLGVLVGAAAGALGGWWAGHTVSDALHSYNDQLNRSLYESRTGRSDYEKVRDYHRFGHVAGTNPDYQDRSFDELETDLRRTWPEERLGRWEDARDSVADGFRTSGRNTGRSNERDAGHDTGRE